MGVFEEEPRSELKGLKYISLEEGTGANSKHIRTPFSVSEFVA
jgi:hypothetical protein